VKRRTKIPLSVGNQNAGLPDCIIDGIATDIFVASRIMF
jgi:hypothetical protein